MEIILIRYGEIGVKGDNKYIFENRLVKNIKNAVKDFDVNVKKEQSRIYIEDADADIVDEVLHRVQKVFGIVEVCRALEIEPNMDKLCDTAVSYIKKFFGDTQKTFKVQTKRANKKFPLSSYEVSKEVGASILRNISVAKVDVHNPEIVLNVEVRDKIYIYSNLDGVPGPGGMPVGTNGRGILMLSGGIDSPVAGYMIAKRGVELDCVHFMSPPYTSERAKEKVVELAKIISQYTGKMKLYLVPFTDIQMAIYEKCPDAQITVIMRRYMMKISEMIAKTRGAQCLISGESIGQVASQTVQSLFVTNESVEMPVFRPFIGFDKQEIVDLSIKVGTYETSILPYEDCCTVFVPKHPVTKPNLEYIKKSESHLEDIIDAMLEKAIEEAEIINI